MDTPELLRAFHVMTPPSLAAWPAQVVLPSPRFCLFLACDARRLDDASLEAWARVALSQGMVYFCGWGPDCARVASCVERAIVTSEIDSSGDHVIPTASHRREPFDRAVEFFRACAKPSRAFRPTTRCWLVANVAGLIAHGELCAQLTDGMLAEAP